MSYSYFLFIGVPRDCNDVIEIDVDAQDGVYSIHPFDDVTKQAEVNCLFDSDGTPWTVSCVLNKI